MENWNRTAVDQCAVVLHQLAPRKMEGSLEMNPLWDKNLKMACKVGKISREYGKVTSVKLTLEIQNKNRYHQKLNNIAENNN